MSKTQPGRKAKITLTSGDSKNLTVIPKHPKHTFNLVNQKSLVIDLTGYSQTLLARQLLQAVLLTYNQNFSQIRRATLVFYATTVRNFLQYYDDNPAKLDLQTLEGETVTTWEQYLRNLKTDRTTYEYVLVLTKLIKIYATEHPIKDNLLLRCTLLVQGDEGTTTPRPALSSTMERKIKTAVDSALTVLISDKPAGHSTKARSLKFKELQERILNGETLNYTNTSLKKEPFTLGEVYHSVYPSQQEMFTLLLKLAFLTGWEPSTLFNLKTTDLGQSKPGLVEIALTKHRNKIHTSRKVWIPDGDTSTPGGLIRYAIVLGAQARKKQNSTHLWLYKPVFKPAFTVIDEEQVYTASKTFVKTHNLSEVNGGLSLRLSQIRKTHKMNRYNEANGNLHVFLEGHTLEVAVKHYLNIPELTDKHQQAVVNGVTELLKSTEPIASQALETTALGSCVDKLNSPFSTKGLPCNAMPWMCLMCPNSVISKRHLPAILAFLKAINNCKTTMESEEWSSLFQTAENIIRTQILPHFTTTQIDHAEQLALVHPIAPMFETIHTKELL